MGSVLILLYITIDVAFEEILTMPIVRHIVNINMVIVQTKKVVVGMAQVQMICDIPVLFGKWNPMPISYIGDT